MKGNGWQWLTMEKIDSRFCGIESKLNDDLELKDWNFLPGPLSYKLPLLAAQWPRRAQFSGNGKYTLPTHSSLTRLVRPRMHWYLFSTLLYILRFDCNYTDTWALNSSYLVNPLPPKRLNRCFPPSIISSFNHKRERRSVTMAVVSKHGGSL